MPSAIRSVNRHNVSAAASFFVEDLDHRLPSGQPVGVGTVHADVAEALPPRHAREEIGLALIAALLCESDLRLQFRHIFAGVDVAVVEHPMLDVLCCFWGALRDVNLPNPDAVLKDLEYARIKLSAGRD